MKSKWTFVSCLCVSLISAVALSTAPRFASALDADQSAAVIAPPRPIATTVKPGELFPKRRGKRMRKVNSAKYNYASMMKSHTKKPKRHKKRRKTHGAAH